MAIDMSGHVDSDFISIPLVYRIAKSGGGYGTDGIYQPGAADVRTPHDVNIQPASNEEIEILEKGGERIIDARILHVNDGVSASISKSDTWEFDSKLYKCHELDNRPWHNYCRAVVSLIDGQS
jgi:hypothetical protein